MKSAKRTGLLFLFIYFLLALAQPYAAEAQLLKKLKRKAQEKLERKAEEKLDRALETSVDTAYARVERLFGIRSRGDEESAILNQGEAGGFATVTFAGESYSHDDFKDVVCTYYTNGVSIDAIINEQYGVILELINVPVTPGNHKGSYDAQAYSSNTGMLSNFEYYTRPDMPARVGSILKKGKVSVASLDKNSVFFSFDGTGGNAETGESISMQGTIKLDFSLVFQNDGMIKNNHTGKSIQNEAVVQSVGTSELEMSSENSTGYSNTEAEQAMAMMQQAMGSTEDIDLPDSYSFDYHIKYEMSSGNDGKDYFETWVSASKNITMMSSGGADEKMIMDGERDAMISLDDSEKMAVVMSSDFSQAMGQNSSQNNPFSSTGLTKTGKTKNILGYKCEEYVAQTPNNQGKVTFWVTNDIDLNTSGPIPGMPGSMTNSGFADEVKGTVMEMYSVESSGEKSQMKMVSFDKTGKTINMGKYKVMKGFGK